MVGEKKMASAVSIEAKPSAVGLKVTSYEHVPGPGKQPADVLCPSNGGLLNVTVLIDYAVIISGAMRPTETERQRFGSSYHDPGCGPAAVAMGRVAASAIAKARPLARHA
jgi:hypothetical protein